MTDKNHDTIVVHCRECPAGMMHRRKITYFTWLGDELVMVPNFPAWVCDFCGKRDYDERAVTMVSMILNPEAGKSVPRGKRTPKPDAAKRKFPQPRTPSDG